MTIDKITNRVRKLLQMADHGTEHEAANAAAAAAALIAQYELDEALIRLDEPSKPAEPLLREERLEPDQKENIKRVAWKETIAHAVAEDLGVKMYYFTIHNGRARTHLRGMGRETAIQTWRYTCAYLWNQIDSMAKAAWVDLAEDMVGNIASAKAWKNAFRVGCATRIAIRMEETRAEKRTERVFKKAAAGVKESSALMLVEKDQDEVDREYAEYSKGWKGGMGGVGSITSGDGYRAGREAGDNVALGSKRAGLTAGQGRLT